MRNVRIAAYGDANKFGIVIEAVTTERSGNGFSCFSLPLTHTGKDGAPLISGTRCRALRPARQSLWISPAFQDPHSFEELIT